MSGHSITVTNDEALVLFEFFARFSDSDELAIQHPAEEIALLRISAQLDKSTADMFEKDHAARLRAARERVVSS
ncbi:MAG: hypothetical protein NXI31_06890 [bacterium]|nr:hypothetical protein [bacterium]